MRYHDKSFLVTLRETPGEPTSHAMHPPFMRLSMGRSTIDSILLASSSHLSAKKLPSGNRAIGKWTIYGWNPLGDSRTLETSICRGFPGYVWLLEAKFYRHGWPMTSKPCRTSETSTRSSGSESSERSDRKGFFSRALGMIHNLRPGDGVSNHGFTAFVEESGIQSFMHVYRVVFWG